jgi:hypothetical protein
MFIYDTLTNTQVILGDLLWGPSRYTRREQWDDGIERLNIIFGGNKRRDVFVQNAPWPRVLSVLGNHDSGMYLCTLDNLDVLSLWRECIGEFHWKIAVGNATLVGFSNPLLQDSCAIHQKQTRESHEWLRQYRRDNEHITRQPVLLTHIPLHAAARVTGHCEGPMRRKNFQISQGSGIGFENVLDATLTREMIDALEPSMVLSGDAHDLCKVNLHSNVYDWTLPSFSWLEGTMYSG